MKCSPRASLGILLSVLLCLTFVSGCTFILPLKSNSSAPPLLTVTEPAGACAEGQTTCSGACRNVQVDSGNCGQCSNVCGSGLYCNNGICTAGTMNVPVAGITTATTVSGTTCAAGQTPCSGVCRNLQADAGNCGRCGNTCSSGRTCSNGACSGGSTTTAVTTPVIPPAAAVTTTTTTPWPACPVGETRCGGACVNTNMDNNNCYGCGNVCSGGRSCTAGVCRCPAVLTWCGRSCVNINTDTSYCGSCSRACGAGMSCCNGACRNLNTDTNNCGACGNVCMDYQSCVAGSCLCPSGQILCGSACKDPYTNNNHCGGCGIVCPSGQYCNAGICEAEMPVVVTTPQPPACSKGLTPCSSVKFGTVCADLDTDNNNCGACGYVCTTGSCSGGTCGYVLK